MLLLSQALFFWLKVKFGGKLQAWRFPPRTNLSGLFSLFIWCCDRFYNQQQLLHLQLGRHTQTGGYRQTGRRWPHPHLPCREHGDRKDTLPLPGLGQATLDRSTLQALHSHKSLWDRSCYTHLSQEADSLPTAAIAGQENPATRAVAATRTVNQKFGNCTTT